MLEPVLQLLDCKPAGFYIDGTAGGGGYAEAILQASAPDGVLLALDWDEEAIIRVRSRLSQYGNRLILENSSFSDLPAVLEKLGFGPADGIVLDLGVSSFHLDDPARGFSFVHDGPLDMRMDLSLSLTAADIVNTYDEKDLADLIYQLGEERLSRRIAKAIVAQRKSSSFSRTAELANLIRAVVPASQDTRRIHPATRTFQALRLAVNRELEALQLFLDHALDLLKPGGRLCIVSFHSLEDRIVKQRFREWARKCRCPQSVLRCECEGRPLGRLLTRKALRPEDQEMDKNPKSRSARLRGIEKYDPKVAF
jgi:16S rRNA (cytosine1402-N4)-methyltransferase